MLLIPQRASLYIIKLLPIFIWGVISSSYDYPITGRGAKKTITKKSYQPHDEHYRLQDVTAKYFERNFRVGKKIIDYRLSK